MSGRKPVFRSFGATPRTTAAGISLAVAGLVVADAVAIRERLEGLAVGGVTSFEVERDRAADAVGRSAVTIERTS